MGLKQAMWTEIFKIIQSNNNFLITSHVNPDGDSLGSEIALYQFLRSKKKNAVIINGSDCAPKYKYLMEGGEVQIFQETQFKAIFSEVEVIFILDTTEKERLGPLKDYILESPVIKICIDHHPITNHLGDLEIVDTSACATGELIFYLLKAAGEKISGRLAEVLYISIITDTGCFRFQNTTPNTHKVAAELLMGGVNPQKVYEEIFERYSQNRMYLLGKVLSKMVFECGGKLVWVSLSKDEIRDSGADQLETDGFSDTLNSIHGVKASILFKELETNYTKISLRSKDDYFVNELAAQFGGGGHDHAAGIIMNCSLESSIKSVITSAINLFGDKNDKKLLKAEIV